MKTNKKELTVFALCAYAIPFLMMPLLYICLQNGRDTSIFANAQMFYPAAGVMLAFLLARRPDTPKRFYILHLLVTAIMLIMSVLSAAVPQPSPNKGTTAQFVGSAGDAFSAICFLQKSRFTSSKPSISAIASDKKCIRHRTNSFVRYCPKTWIC